ncbi:sigma-70 family RNA polymerase sigma factor [Rossellomorea marisflavi]|uniref:sigma-70 family RNA polymerase sigma factor n=1 Tax=Rossellomorea marisflavi TaxID=189381 RepID=UPI00203B2600|nr:sigma-70 family RNA polymerase sigma factor [Rossellomorea marisflavi]MCM2606351.1 sigma-70 family RNA polymerase sigma factor [Rossellomorea marisflavi]
MEPFELVHEQYSQMIHKIIHTLRIYKNHHDYYQTGLIALWEAYMKFEPSKGTFTSFAYSYIRGRILSELKREVQVEERGVALEEGATEAGGDDLDTLSVEILLSYCENLTANQKKWVIAHSLHMLSISEIADMEGVSPEAVKKWRKGAKERIRQAILNQTFV